MERLKSGSLGQCHHCGRLRFVGASVTFVNQKGERGENIINRGSTMGCWRFGPSCWGKKKQSCDTSLRSKKKSDTMILYFQIKFIQLFIHTVYKHTRTQIFFMLFIFLLLPPTTIDTFVLIAGFSFWHFPFSHKFYWSRTVWCLSSNWCSSDLYANADLMRILMLYAVLS